MELIISFNFHWACPHAVIGIDYIQLVYIRSRLGQGMKFPVSARHDTLFGDLAFPAIFYFLS